MIVAVIGLISMQSVDSQLGCLGPTLRRPASFSWPRAVGPCFFGLLPSLVIQTLALSSKKNRSVSFVGEKYAPNSHSFFLVFFLEERFHIFAVG